MRYMLLIGSDDKMQDQAPPPKAQMDAMIQGHMRFGDELRAKGKMVAADRLRPDGDASRIRFKAGQRVYHPKFGEGTVIDARPDGQDEEVQVRFVKYGMKLLAASFANLIVLDK